MDLLTIPLEVFQAILTYLDIDDIKRLRLVNRALATRSIGQRFLAFIQQPTLDVSGDTLRSLHALASNPALSRKIHTVTFLATSFESSELEKTLHDGYRVVREAKRMMVSMKRMPCTPEELADIREQVAWLKAKQEARDVESADDIIGLLESVLKAFRGLDNIRLDAAIVHGPGQKESPLKGEWNPIWTRASHVFYLVLTALGRSGVSVKTLDAYRNTPRCCIPSGDITSYISNLNTEQLTLLGELMESLQLSISTEIEKDFSRIKAARAQLQGYHRVSHELFGSSTGYLSKDDPRAVLADGTPGLASLLKHTPNLRRLDIHFRQTLQGGHLNSYDRILGAIANEVQLPLLVECSLSGFLVTEEALFLFLKKHPQLQKLTVQECQLTRGSWTPIFAHLDKAMPELESLHLSNLVGKRVRNTEHQNNDGSDGDNGMVNLKPVWDNSENVNDYFAGKDGFPCMGGYHHHTRSFNREDLKKGLVFQPAPMGYPMGSPSYAQWIEQRQAIYGPP